ncbi:MAG: hypothetical protein AUH85_11670 [Chloroflexi bacterium 13_1_40CM_4_68_4]|nr:MAG: hypothetical protein AUH85_11670 [Chloroflexi bacterium 13_1_40CM_4_68_4]
MARSLSCGPLWRWLANASDADAAVDEYARFVEVALKSDDVRRAAGELACGLAALGEAPHLQAVGARRLLRTRPVSRDNEEVPASRRRVAVESGSPSVGEATSLTSFERLARRVDAFGFRTIGFTSTVFGEGVSTTALGTASSLAALRNGDVLLVDANWMQPTLTTDAHLESVAGLADYLAKSVDLASVTRPTCVPGLDFIPLGDRTAVTQSRHALVSLLAEDAVRYHTVVVDLPPVLEGEPFVLPWAAALKQLFVVLHEGATPVALVRKALSRLEIATTPGIILNQTRENRGDLAADLAAARE